MGFEVVRGETVVAVVAVVTVGGVGGVGGVVLAKDGMGDAFELVRGDGRRRSDATSWTPPRPVIDSVVWRIGATSSAACSSPRRALPKVKTDERAWVRSTRVSSHVDLPCRRVQDARGSTADRRGASLSTCRPRAGPVTLDRAAAMATTSVGAFRRVLPARSSRALAGFAAGAPPSLPARLARLDAVALFRADADDFELLRSLGQVSYAVEGSAERTLTWTGGGDAPSRTPSPSRVPAASRPATPS